MDKDIFNELKAVSNWLRKNTTGWMIIETCSCQQHLGNQRFLGHDQQKNAVVTKEQKGKATKRFWKSEQTVKRGI